MGRRSVKPLKRLRTMVTAVVAIATGLVRTTLERETAARIELRPGDVAPDFVLEASDGCTYRLSQFAGHQVVVLAWFPVAFTGGCTTECESIGGRNRELRQFQAACFAASTDRPETLRRFAASTGIEVPILSDPQRTVARAYGVLGASGFPARRTFFIGTDGRILAIDADVNAPTHGADIVDRLTALQVAKQI
jgi:peroxiredoxin Q/BCP